MPPNNEESFKSLRILSVWFKYFIRAYVNSQSTQDMPTNSLPPGYFSTPKINIPWEDNPGDFLTIPGGILEHESDRLQDKYDFSDPGGKDSMFSREARKQMDAAFCARDWESCLGESAAEPLASLIKNFLKQFIKTNDADNNQSEANPSLNQDGQLPAQGVLGSSAPLFSGETFQTSTNFLQGYVSDSDAFFYYSDDYKTFLRNQDYIKQLEYLTKPAYGLSYDHFDNDFNNLSVDLYGTLSGSSIFDPPPTMLVPSDTELRASLIAAGYSSYWVDYYTNSYIASGDDLASIGLTGVGYIGDITGDLVNNYFV